MWKSILITIMIMLLSTLALSKTLVFSYAGKLYQFSEEMLFKDGSRNFVSVDFVDEVLKDSIVSSSANGKELFIILPGGKMLSVYANSEKAILDFNETFEHVVLSKGSKIYLDASFICYFLNLSQTETESSVIFYDQPFRLMNIQKGTDSVIFEFDRPVPMGFINYWHTETGALIVTFKPVVSDDVNIGSEFEVYSGKQMLRFLLDGKSEWYQAYPVFDGKRVIIRKSSGWGRVLSTSSGESYKLSSVEGIVSGRKFVITLLEFEPEAFKIELAYGGNGIPSVRDIRDIAEKNGAFAVINAGYFDPSNNFPIGLLVDKGEIVSLPSLGRPIFFVTRDGEIGISRMDIELFLKVNERKVRIKGVNTPYKGELLVYNDHFNGIIPYYEDFTYLNIKNGIVVGKSYNERVEKGTYTLLISPTGLEKTSEIDVGQKVEFETYNSYGYNLDFAVEGGPLIISNGDPASEYERNFYNSSLLDNRAPRTFVGITTHGSLVFMVVDGYQSRSYGLSFKEMIEFFSDKNFSNLMCLDGGRSSAIVVGGKLLNSPSSGAPVLPVAIMIDYK
ncbi:MAG: phosphodiester glycosidase family protein [Kosmotoga sp.]|uniref:phosphodiester glycosidase family protein n=1 Tax=Kosmotoga sp. TaxID=1955248 RepID=UPI001D8ABEC0|nr:phosphodiester glycosidase family protein [Kosmotoga sp.]MBO8165654.1 phosphodiester glycosidase family protein [Kosmotoga sp.]